MKILVIRFSSIGDIVLTTPILRALRSRFPEARIHYLTKAAFAGVISGHPAVDRQVLLGEDWQQTVKELREAGPYDQIIDLHKNLRSKRVIRLLDAPVLSFDKINWGKWLAVNIKWKGLPLRHLVTRYFEGLDSLELQYDGKGLDFHTHSDAHSLIGRFGLKDNGYVVLVAGAAHATKRIPPEKLVEIAAGLTLPAVVVGGKQDHHPSFSALQGLDLCGSTNLDESAVLIRHANAVITSDTGMMHIATAFRKPMAVVWGNTIPEFGMYPFDHHSQVKWFQVEGLRCRPCSKIGYKKCPKGHFRCMMDQNYTAIIQFINAVQS